ncbi:uncharacterized protein I206_107760 [Kwoniella pini CBS 10737]|uniref:Uncharacterized protein n=1 Tax=Kwoniella pini CBS 10737 TaxID=1296096 RepID=A0A1B9HY80_9TREE|nr:uncharacterized protein I206_06092 [Kwoniella pini CBS 10737]OCF48224.1 hypothetical protein I206_06092 [Kwoniella pini CBS 10737]
MVRRKWDSVTLGFMIIAGVGVFLVPFSFFLVVSLSPRFIHTLSLARVKGNVFDNVTQSTVKVEITVGPSGGCMWYNSSTPICSAKIPYVPSAEYLHLPPNQNLTSIFPIAMGRALPMNHVMVILMGLCLIVAILDVFLFEGGIAWIIISFSSIMLWIVYFLESAYIKLLNTRIGNIYEHDSWEYHTGNGYILVTVATFVASIFICGSGGD